MNSILLKVTSSVVIAGEIARAGQLVELTASEAKTLLHGGKAVLATVGDEPSVEVPVPVATVAAAAVGTETPHATSSERSPS